MSSKNMNKNITGLIEAIVSVAVTALENAESKKGKTKIKNLVALFQSDETKEALAKAVSANLPKTKRSGGAPKLKDPNEPKRARSSYIYFCQDNRDKATKKLRITKEEYDDLDEEEQANYTVNKKNDDYYNPKATVVLKKLGEMWKNLSEKKRKKYEDLAKEDKIRRDEEMADYERPSDEELADLDVNKRRISKANKATSKKTKKKDSDAPKRPTSAFLYFAKDMRAQVKEDNPELTGAKISKELGRLWKEDYAEEEDRAKWVALAEESKEAYKEAMADYKEKTSGSESESAPAPKKKESKKKESKKKESKKKASSDEESDEELKPSKKVVVKISNSDDDEPKTESKANTLFGSSGSSSDSEEE